MLTSVFILIGSLAILVATIGIVRMPDPLCKMHAAAKASTVGISSYAIAYISHAPTLTNIAACITIVGFLFLTMPIACHVLSSRYVNRKK